MSKLRTALLAVGGALALAAPAQGAVQVSQSGWQWGNPQPQGNTIRTLDFAAGRGYAVGDAGTALRTDDGGTTYTGLATGTSANLDRLQLVNQDVVILQGGNGCVVRRSDDGGRTFRRILIAPERECPDPVQTAFFANPQTGYLVRTDGSVIRSDDGGESYAPKTAIPTTRASTASGANVPADVVFTSPDAGIAVLAGGSRAYRTTDGATSWTPLDLPQGNVRRLVFVSPQVAYAVGPNTILRSDDGGQTFERRGGAEGQDITGIRCATTEQCLLSVAGGGRLLRTTDGGETVSPVTAATDALFAAAFASPGRAVAAGAGGATVVSDDGGVNFRRIGGGIEGNYPYGVRPGPGPDIAFALGRGGQLARTDDAGANWRFASVPTRADLRDLAFPDPQTGYVLDQNGELFRTRNGGTSWQELDPGTTGTAGGVITAGDAVLIAGPVGVRRSVGGEGRFDAIASRAVRRARVDQFDRAGTAVIAYGAVNAVLSTDRGRSFRALRVPSFQRGGGRRATVRIRDLDMLTTRRGFLLDTTGRLWTTGNGGRSWTELPGVGTEEGVPGGLSFASPTVGFLAIERFAGDPSSATVLRTGDGGRTWRPQRVSVGRVGINSVVAPTTNRAYLVTGTVGGDAFRNLFTTASGGDFGQATRLTLRSRTRTIGRRAARRGADVLLEGTLPGAQGGEPVVVAARNASGGGWTQQVVQAGANGGSFTARFRVRQASVVVAQFAGDSARTGAGSRPVVVRLSRR